MIQPVAIAKPHLQNLTKTIAILFFGVAFITLCAKLRVPFWPVPMTLHVFAVMSIAVATGPRLATATVFAYLTAGAAGLPVFSGTPERGIGLAYMIGPTGGYLLGFLIASWLTGTLAQGRKFIGRTMALLAGLAATYTFGLLWLGFYVSADKIIPLGFAPFILGDLISIFIVSFAFALTPPRFVRKFSR